MLCIMVYYYIVGNVIKIFSSSQLSQNVISRMVTNLDYMEKNFPLVDMSLLKVIPNYMYISFLYSIFSQQLIVPNFTNQCYCMLILLYINVYRIQYSIIMYSMFQFKERDMLEGVFKFWRNTDPKCFDITKCWYAITFIF